MPPASDTGARQRDAAEFEPHLNALIEWNDSDERSREDVRELIPSWAKDSAIGHKLINARSETVAEKPSFRSAFPHRRCLIPADGFYEWQRRGKTRQPWLFGLHNGEPLVFAGLWERWTVPAGAALTGSLAERSPGDAVETCTILTTAANETVAPVHGRMPVILPLHSWDAWLMGGNVPLAPYPACEMTAWPVSAHVNRPANDDPRCVEPISLN